MTVQTKDPPSRARLASVTTEGGAASRAAITVADVMSAPVKTVGLQTSARAAAECMRVNGLLHLVVIDDRGRVVGVLSDRDLRAAQPSVLLIRDPAMRENALSLIHVEDVMSKHPQVIREDLPIAEALVMMLHHKVGSIIVVDTAEHPIGIVTGLDVVKLTLRLVRAR